MQTQFGLLGPQTGHHPLRLPANFSSRAVVLHRPSCDRRSRHRQFPVHAAATSTKEPSLEVDLASRGRYYELIWIHVPKRVCYAGQQDPDPGQQCCACNWHRTAREQQSTSESAEATHCHPGVWLGCYELHERHVQERQVHSLAHSARRRGLTNLEPVARSFDISTSQAKDDICM